MYVVCVWHCVGFGGSGVTADGKRRRQPHGRWRRECLPYDSIWCIIGTVPDILWKSTYNIIIYSVETIIVLYNYYYCFYIIILLLIYYYYLHTYICYLYIYLCGIFPKLTHYIKILIYDWNIIRRYVSYVTTTTVLWQQQWWWCRTPSEILLLLCLYEYISCVVSLYIIGIISHRTWEFIN